MNLKKIITKKQTGSLIAIPADKSHLYLKNIKVHPCGAKQIMTNVSKWFANGNILCHETHHVKCWHPVNFNNRFLIIGINKIHRNKRNLDNQSINFFIGEWL